MSIHQRGENVLRKKRNAAKYLSCNFPKYNLFFIELSSYAILILLLEVVNLYRGGHIIERSIHRHSTVIIK